MDTKSSNEITTVAHEFVALKVSDRGDCCGVEALVQAHKPGVGTLLFCGHHFESNEASLFANGWDWDKSKYDDRRKTGNTKPDSSAAAGKGPSGATARD